MGCEPGPGPLTPEQAACYLMRYPDLLALVAKVGVDNASRASFMYNDSLNERFDLVQKHWASTLAAGDYLQRMGTPGEYRTHACEVHSRGDVQRALDYLTHGQCPAPPSEQIVARRASAAAARRRSRVADSQSYESTKFHALPNGSIWVKYAEYA